MAIQGHLWSRILGHSKGDERLKLYNNVGFISYGSEDVLIAALSFDAPSSENPAKISA